MKFRWFITKKHLVGLIGLLVAALLLLLLNGCADERAQVAADTRAGVNAVRAAYEAGAATSDILAILKGIDDRLPAVAGVNSADWPAPTWTLERITAAPVEYAQSAPPEPARWGFWAAAGGIGVAALGILRVIAPMIPGGGPIVKMAADLVWNVMATRDQKATDAAAAMTHQAASHIAPILDAVRALPPGTLPPHVQQMLDVPMVRAALDHVAAAK